MHLLVSFRPYPTTEWIGQANINNSRSCLYYFEAFATRTPSRPASISSYRMTQHVSSLCLGVNWIGIFLKQVSWWIKFISLHPRFPEGLCKFKFSTDRQEEKIVHIDTATLPPALPATNITWVLVYVRSELVHGVQGFTLQKETCIAKLMHEGRNIGNGILAMTILGLN